MYQEYVIYLAILLVNVWVWSVLLHELAHVLYYRYVTGCWPKVWFDGAINVGTNNQIRKLKTRQRRTFYIIGPAVGVIPCIYCPVPEIGLMAFIVYIWGCKWDLRKFIE